MRYLSARLARPAETDDARGMRVVYPASRDLLLASIREDERGRWYSVQSTGSRRRLSAMQIDLIRRDHPPKSAKDAAQEAAALHAASGAIRPLVDERGPRGPAQRVVNAVTVMALCAIVFAAGWGIVAVTGGGSGTSDPRGATYCDQNPYARDCPLEDRSQRPAEDQVARDFKKVTGKDYTGFKDGTP